MIKLIDLLSEGKPCWKGYKQVGMKEKDGRQVPNCVPINEDIDPLEAITIVGSVQTIVDGKRDVGYIVLKHSSKDEIEQIKTLVSDNNLKIQPVKGEQKPIIIYKTGNESAAKELKDIAEKYNGYLSYKATEEESRRIGEILGYSKKSIDKYIEKIKASGLVKEIVTDTEIICDNCGWTWDIKDGGDDLYICHNILPSGNMCRHDNNPDLGEGKKLKALDTTEEIDEYDVETLEEIKSFSKFIKEYTQTLNEAECDCVFEAEYRGRKVTLGKPMQGDVKKFKVYVKNPKGKVVKVNFGQKGMNIKRNNPVRRKAYRARHNCANPGPRHKANYWSCRKW
jgi:hypothetical protein